MKTDIDITKWDGYDKFSQPTIYMGDEAKEYKEKFENRIKEITKTAFE